VEIKKAEPSDVPAALEMAARHEMDYEGLEKDDIWMALEAGRLLGIAALRRFPEGVELCGLVVDSEERHNGVGGRLVQAVLQAVPGDVYLQTIIPGFFARLGFDKVDRPPAFIAKPPSWCVGCQRELCTTMLRKRT